MVEEDHKLEMEGEEEEDPGQGENEENSDLDQKWKDRIKEKFAIFDKDN